MRWIGNFFRFMFFERRPLRNPMYSLLIAPEFEMRDAIHRGEKTITIREGLRDYREGGSLAIFCHIAPWAVLATIDTVRHTTFRELTEKECQDDGAESAEALLDSMKRFGGRYADMTMNSAVTVIRWKDVRGYWAENAEKYCGDEIKLLG